jgi:hypothetical protein
VTGEGTINLTDAISVLNYLFRGLEVVSCEDAADVDDNGTLNLTDVIVLLNHLFRGGPPIAPPYPDAGVDPTPDQLRCP